jgi:hypothetical protein
VRFRLFFFFSPSLFGAIKYGAYISIESVILIAGVKTATPHACKSECEGITKAPGLLSLHSDLRYLVLSNFRLFSKSLCWLL